METQKTSAKKFIINYGVLLGILSVLLGAVIYITNSYTDPHWIFSVLGVVILIGVIVYAIKAFKKANGGFLTLGQALKVGISIAAISGLLFAIYNAIFNLVIDPGFAEQMLDITREKLAENPNMTEEQIEMSIDWARKLGGPVIGGAFFIVMSVFFGFIYSLIGGLIMQKKQDLY